MIMEKAVDAGDDVWMIDTHIGDIQGFAAVYVLRGEKGCALFDSGVSGSVVSIMEGLEAAGIAPDEVLCIIVSHIHLDHAGGAGYLLKEMPNARVMITDIGMESMMNPERLLKSAHRALGALSSLYGDMIPIDRERILPVEGQREIDLGGQDSQGAVQVRIE